MRFEIKKESLYYLFILLPFFLPSMLNGYLYIGTIVTFLKFFVAVFVILKMLKRHRFSYVLIIITGFYMLICISAKLHGISFSEWLDDIILLWLIDLLTTNKKTLIYFLEAFVGLYTVWFLINLCTMIVFPNGLYANSMYELNWFLGYKNVMIRRLIPWVTMYFTLKILDNKAKYKLGKKDIFIFIVAILTILLSQSFNSIIGLTVYIILFIYLLNKKSLPNYIILKSFALYCIFDIIMIKFNFIELFQNFIGNVLDRSNSEAARVVIWERTLDWFAKSPAIGYGGVLNEMYNIGISVSHPHNLLLYYLMLAGIIGVFMLFCAIFFVEYQIKKITNEQIKKIYNLFAISYISFFSMGFLESLTGATMLIPMLIILYNILIDK